MGPLRAPMPILNPGTISRISGERAEAGGGLDFGTFLKLPKQFHFGFTKYDLSTVSITVTMDAGERYTLCPHPRPRDQDRCRQSSGDSSAQHPVRTTAPVCISNARPMEMGPASVHRAPRPTQACRQVHLLPPWLPLMNAHALSTNPDLIND